ncbi:MAG: MarR family transcriptional regulator [Alphaproteobacteria bacterium]
MSNKNDLRLMLKAMRRMARALDVQSSAINREVGLTLPQLMVLECVHDLGEVTTRDVSRAVDLSPPTVVGILDKLEAKGLIERYRSLVDRRVVHTRLTRGGDAVLQHARAIIWDRFDQRFAALPARTQSIMVAALEQAADLFEGVTPSAADEVTMTALVAASKRGVPTDVL